MEWICDKPGCKADPKTSRFTKLESEGRGVTLCEKHWKEGTARLMKALKLVQKEARHG